MIYRSIDDDWNPHQRLVSDHIQELFQNVPSQEFRFLSRQPVFLSYQFDFFSGTSAFSEAILSIIKEMTPLCQFKKESAWMFLNYLFPYELLDLSDSRVIFFGSLYDIKIYTSYSLPKHQILIGFGEELKPYEFYRKLTAVFDVDAKTKEQ